MYNWLLRIAHIIKNKLIFHKKYLFYGSFYEKSLFKHNTTNWKHAIG